MDVAIYQDRTEAGRTLAAKLAAYADRPEVTVLALPRGGVPVAFEVARSLHAPLDVFVVRKLGVPGHSELAMGAVASGGVRLVDERLVKTLGISREMIDEVAADEENELRRRERMYRIDRPEVPLQGRIIILVDDGLATGWTMRAAISALRHHNVARIVVAVPVGAPETCEQMKAEADEAICARTPAPFYSVGQWYGDFSQTTDREVRELLVSASALPHPSLSEAGHKG